MYINFNFNLPYLTYSKFDWKCILKPSSYTSEDVMSLVTFEKIDNTLERDRRMRIKPSLKLIHISANGL